MNRFSAFLEKGSEYYDDKDAKRRVLIVNIILIIIMVLSFFIGGYNVLEKEYIKLVPLIGVMIGAVISFSFNRRGKHQIATYFISTLLILAPWLVVFFHKHQTAAPYVELLVAIEGILILRKSRLKNVIIFVGLFSFFVLNYYQLKYLPFHDIEYLFLLFMMTAFYFTMKIFQQKLENHKDELQEKNLLLEEKNIKIKEQTETILALKQQEHDKEIKSKQGKLDTVLMSLQLQQEIKEQVAENLYTVLKSKNVKEDLKKLILELNAQKELDEKITFVTENIEELEVEFMENLTQKHPELSQKERELCSYIRLGLSTKEIANMKNTRVNTINVMKFRVKKKMNIESDIAAYLTKI